MATGRVLHVLSQRPGLTGSGVTLDALVRHAHHAGWEQAAVVGVPTDGPAAQVGNLPPSRIRPLLFGANELPFPVPGMSDVMPYASTRYSAMTPDQLDAYRMAWREHLAKAIEALDPDVIHSHHLWIVTSLLPDLAPATPIVVHCHATGLRQMELCPHLAHEVREGCSRADRFLVLHHEHAERLKMTLGVDESSIHVVGAGFRQDLFHQRGRRPGSGERLLFVGKICAAKGLPWLLDAFGRLAARRPGLELHVAGSGDGAEAQALRRRMERMAPEVVLHGQLAQAPLADLMRQCSVCVLPSLFEGLPLVLVEARACGCRLVATALPGVVESLAPHLGEALETVRPPALRSVDVPDETDVPRFVDQLEGALERALSRPGQSPPNALEPFTWGAVYRRVEAVWRELVAPSKTPQR